MRKFRLSLSAVASSIALAGFLAGSAQASKDEWSSSRTLDGVTLQISKRNCYDSPGISSISFYWYKSLPRKEEGLSPDGANVSSECGCGETLEINGTLRFDASSLLDVLKTDVPADFTGYRCFAPGSK